MRRAAVAVNAPAQLDSISCPELPNPEDTGGTSIRHQLLHRLRSEKVTKNP